MGGYGFTCYKVHHARQGCCFEQDAAAAADAYGILGFWCLAQCVLWMWHFWGAWRAQIVF